MSFKPITNKIFKFGMRKLLLGIVAIIIIYTSALLISPGNSLSINYLMYTTAILVAILFAYYLLTKKKFDLFKTFVFLSGLAVGIWIFDHSALNNWLFKYFVISLGAVVSITTLAKIITYAVTRFKRDVKIDKHGIRWGININVTKNSENNYGSVMPLDSFEKINRIRENVSDESLFTAFEGRLNQLKIAVRNESNVKFNRIFCVNGSWGSGKTTLIKLLNESLLKAHNKTEPKYKEPVWLDFNPWLYSNQDELVKDFFADFKHKAYENWGIDLEPEIFSITKAITPSFEGLGLKIPFIDLLPTRFTLFETSDENKHSLNKKLKGIDRPFIIVFDDVDRPCETSEIVLIVKLISLLSNLNNVTVVTAFDYKRVSKLISGQTNDIGQKFLEKFIHKTYTIPAYEYKELESIFISNLIDTNKLSKNSINSAKPIFQEFVWAANRQWFRVSESQRTEPEPKNIILDPLYERYKDIYIELNPGGNYPKDYKDVIQPAVVVAITDLVNGSTTNMDSLVRSFVKPIQKIKRSRLWNDHSLELMTGLAQFGIPDSEDVYTTISSFLNERDDLYGQNLHDQIFSQFAPLEQKYPKIITNDYKTTYEGFRDAFLGKVQEYINKFEDVKGDDYTKVVNWLIERMTPRDVVRFAYNIDEELTDWDNKEVIERITETSVKELYQYTT